MFKLGFSYVGLIYLLMLFLPNIIYIKYKPEHYEEYVKNESKVLVIIERIGQILVCINVLIFSDFNIRNTPWIIWLILSFFLMILYELYWIKYFKSKHTIQDFYSTLFPLSGSILPIFAFILLAIYGTNIFLLISTIILGIGHIGIHMNHHKEIVKIKNTSKTFIIKLVASIFAFIFITINVLIIGGRNINYINHYKMIKNGVDEEIYLNLGGQEQYVLMRGMNVNNPVIIYLHGGPSSPDSFISYGFTNYLIDNYTIVSYDQRGCGKTYFHNIKIDSNNESISYEQSLDDLNDLVDYSLKRFNQKQVIILGHSYGTILGSEYSLRYKEKVSTYVAIAQVTSIEKTDLYSYNDALIKANEAGDDTSELILAYENFIKNNDLISLMNLRKITSKYHPAKVSDKSINMALFSPYFGIDDLKWFIKQNGNLEDYFALNQPLFDYTLNFDVYNNELTYNMPVYFISGDCDWICPIDSIKEYAKKITAPEVKMVTIEGCGHNVQYSNPQLFTTKLKELLNK